MYVGMVCSVWREAKGSDGEVGKPQQCTIFNVFLCVGIDNDVELNVWAIWYQEPNLQQHIFPRHDVVDETKTESAPETAPEGSLTVWETAGKVGKVR